MQNKTTVDIAYVCRLADNLTLGKLSRKYAVERHLGFKIVGFILFYICSAVLFYNYYILRAVAHKVLSEASPVLVLAVFFCSFPVFYLIMSYSVRLGGIKKRYRHNKYREKTCMLRIDDSGVCFSTPVRVTRFEWESVLRVVECGEGFVFVCGTEYLFLPARFITAENLRKIRTLLINNIRQKVVFVSPVTIADEVEKCEPYRMLSLEGTPVFTASCEPPAFKDYFKSCASVMLRKNPEPFFIAVYLLVFMLIFAVLSAGDIFSGFFVFLLASACICGIISVLIYIYICARYQCDVLYTSFRSVVFYPQAVYIASQSERTVMEYETVTLFAEHSEKILLADDFAYVTVPSNESDDYKKLLDLLKLKTGVR